MFSEFFLTYTALTKEQVNREFVVACTAGDIKAIKYLLTSDEIEHNADIASENHAGIIRACLADNLEAVKFLLTSEEIQEHSYIHAKDDAAFKCACHYESYQVINYLINEYQIEETYYIQDYLSEKPNPVVTALFLNRSLENQLGIVEGKKNKIFKI